MTRMSWSELYKDTLAGRAAGLPSGDYDVEVDFVRTLAASRMLFLTLKVLSGPEKDKTTDVGLWLPTPGHKAVFHFQTKITGFGDLGPVFQSMDAFGDDTERALDVLATALTGKQVRARIQLVAEGDYAGSNELVATKPLEAADRAD